MTGFSEHAAPIPVRDTQNPTSRTSPAKAYPWIACPGAPAVPWMPSTHGSAARLRRLVTSSTVSGEEMTTSRPQNHSRHRWRSPHPLRRPPGTADRPRRQPRQDQAQRAVEEQVPGVGRKVSRHGHHEAQHPSPQEHHDHAPGGDP